MSNLCLIHVLSTIITSRSLVSQLNCFCILNNYEKESQRQLQVIIIQRNPSFLINYGHNSITSKGPFISYHIYFDLVLTDYWGFFLFFCFLFFFLNFQLTLNFFTYNGMLLPAHGKQNNKLSLYSIYTSCCILKERILTFITSFESSCGPCILNY